MIKKISLIVLCILLLTSVSYSATDARKQSFFDNSGGLNDKFSPILIEDNEASNLDDIVFTKAGTWRTREGYNRINSGQVGSNIACIGGKYYKTVSGERFLVSVWEDGTIRKMDYDINGPDGTWDDITGDLIFEVDRTHTATFAVGEDTLIIEDGVGSTPPYKWTGIGNAELLGGSPPNASIVVYHKRQAFFAGDRDNPSVLYFTDLGDIENSTTGLSGNVSVETNDGTIIRVLAPGFDALYIWKDRSIWRLSGDDKDTFSLQRMVTDIGTLSADSVSLISNSFFFTDGQGDTYIYDGAIGLRLISTKIEGTKDNLNSDRFQYIKTATFNKDYYASVSDIGVGYNNRLLVFDTFPLAWTKFSNFHASALWVADNGRGQDILIFSDYNGYIYKYPFGDDDAGSPITWSYTTKKYSFPELSAGKDWTILRVFAKQWHNAAISITPRADFGTAGTATSMSLKGTKGLFGTKIFGTDVFGGKNIIIQRLEPNLEGNFFQIYFNGSVPAEIEGWQMWIKETQTEGIDDQ